MGPDAATPFTPADTEGVCCAPVTFCLTTPDPWSLLSDFWTTLPSLGFRVLELDLATEEFPFARGAVGGRLVATLCLLWIKVVALEFFSSWSTVDGFENWGIDIFLIGSFDLASSSLSGFATKLATPSLTGLLHTDGRGTDVFTSCTVASVCLFVILLSVFFPGLAVVWSASCVFLTADGKALLRLCCCCRICSNLDCFGIDFGACMPLGFEPGIFAELIGILFFAGIFFPLLSLVPVDESEPWDPEGLLA